DLEELDLLLAFCDLCVDLCHFLLSLDKTVTVQIRILDTGLPLLFETVQDTRNLLLLARVNGVLQASPLTIPFLEIPQFILFFLQLAKSFVDEIQKFVD